MRKHARASRRPGVALKGSNMVGSAALFGFVLIYFHEVRGIPLDRAGFAVGAMSFTMVIFTPFAGFLSDHVGAQQILVQHHGLWDLLEARQQARAAA